MSKLNATAGSLLGFLHRGPMSGWDLLREIDQSIGGFWNVTQSQVYKELRRLQTAGLVEIGAAGVRERRPYQITERGKHAFSEWALEDPGRDLIRSRLMVTVFFGALVPPQRLHDIVANRRRQAEADLARYRSLEPLVADADPFTAATLRFGIMYAEAMTEWAKSVEQLAERAARTEKPRRSTRPTQPRKSRTR